MKIIPTNLPEVLLLAPQVFGDERGFFMETYNARTFAGHGLDMVFVQDNQSRSARGVLRGLHYQLQQTQGKLVRVGSGSAFDVAVDIRRSSPNFGKWTGHILSAANKHMLWVPRGFAHGFLSMEDDTDLLYKCTDLYAPEHERSIAWNDTDIGIEWPLGDIIPALSGRDAKGAALSAAEVFA
ncbi:MAG TPA: dTDP-4-dehydrorhamnose 3,5-epimerase [Sphingomicrobium sp.]|jgi:dTDP-4-dehydrorhamnose 3,5-epimerase